MTPSNFPDEVARSTELVRREGPSANGTTIIETGSFRVFELVQNTANTIETRNLTGPRKSGIFLDLVLYSVASGGSITVTLKDSAGNTSGTITFSTAYTGVMLKSWPSGSGVWQWVPYFSNV